MAVSKVLLASNVASATAQATASLPAVSSVQYMAIGIVASIASGATASGVCTVVLRDGATGVGTILWTAVLASPVGGSNELVWNAPTDALKSYPFGITGTAGNAMTLEFTAGGAATSVQSVQLIAVPVV